MEDLHDVTAFHTRGQRNTSIKYRNITYNFLIFNRTCYIVLLNRVSIHNNINIGMTKWH